MNRFAKVLAAALPLVGTFAFAASYDQLAATKHNFATGSYANINNGVNNTMCQPCHTPHHAVTNDNVSTRLWNHATTVTGYTLYDGTYGGYTGEIDGSQGMDRVSRLCLGCHDGTVALDSYGMGTDGTPAGHVGSINWQAGAVSNLGTDFRDDHPVGIKAVAATSSGALPTGAHLKTPTVTYTDATNTVAKSVKIGNISLFQMSSGNFVVGCKSCHNPHGSGTAALTPYAHLLADTPSTLCNNCHTK